MSMIFFPKDSVIIIITTGAQGTGPPKSVAKPSDSSHSAGMAALARYENKGKQSQAQKMKAAVAREMMEERNELEKTRPQHQIVEQLEEPEVSPTSFVPTIFTIRCVALVTIS